MTAGTLPLGFSLFGKALDYPKGIEVPRSKTPVELMSVALPAKIPASVILTLTGGNIDVVPGSPPGPVDLVVSQRSSSGAPHGLQSLKISPKWTTAKTGHVELPLSISCTVTLDASLHPTDLVLSWSTQTDLEIGPGSIALTCIGLDEPQSSFVDTFVKGDGVSGTLSKQIDLDGTFKQVVELRLATTSANHGGTILVVGCAEAPVEGNYNTVANYEIRLREALSSGQAPVYYAGWEAGVIAQQTMSAGSRGVIVGAYQRKATTGVTVVLEMRCTAPGAHIDAGEFASMFVLQEMHASQSPQPFLGSTRFVADHPVYLTVLHNPLQPMPHLNRLTTGGPVSAGGGILQAYFSMGSALYDKTATAPDRRIEAALYGPDNGKMAAADYGPPYDVALSGPSQSAPQATSASITLALNSIDKSGTAPYGQWGYIPANSSAFLAYIYEPG